MSTSHKTISIYWHHTRQYSWLFWAGVFGGALAVVLQDIVPPFIISRTFTKLQISYATHQAISFSSLRSYFLVYSIFLLAGAIVWRLQSLAVWIYEIKVIRDLSIRCFNFLQNQGYRFHSDRFSGALVAQSNRFSASYERLMDEFVWSIVPGITALLAAMIFLSFVFWQYAFVLLGVVVIYISIMYRRIARQMPLNRREASMQSEQTAALADALTNVTTIKTFVAEPYEHKRFGLAANRTYQASIDVFRAAFKNTSASHFMTASINVTALLFGLLAVTNLHANVGVLILSIAYTQAITGRLWQFGQVMRNITRAFGDAADMTEILNLPSEIKDPPNPVKLGNVTGEIIFEHTNFSYQDGSDDTIFDDLNLQIASGQKVGLVGHSGGGKTTVTKLLLRFLDIQGGSIRIDGKDIREVAQADLRSQIAYVTQEPLLFHRSIAENISYGNPAASRSEIIKASKLAHADEFTKKLPSGYETLVGERGIKLSGGQRQRVAIARAMLKDAPILVLDEATSSLDSESEKLIQDALWKLMEGRTAIVIAHRLSTIQKMDRIVVLEEGKIVEEGTHKELLTKKGVYASLWAHQSGGFLED